METPKRRKVGVSFVTSKRNSSEKKGFNRIVMLVILLALGLLLFWLTHAQSARLLGANHIWQIPIWLLALLLYAVVAVIFVHFAYDDHAIDSLTKFFLSLFRIGVLTALFVWWYFCILVQVGVGVEKDLPLVFRYGEIAILLAGISLFGLKEYGRRLKSAQLALVLSALCFFFLHSVGWSAGTLQNDVPWLYGLSVLVYLLAPILLLIGLYLFAKLIFNSWWHDHD